MCARSPNVRGRTSGEPRSTLAESEGRMPGDRATGGCVSLVTFLCISKESNPLARRASGSFAFQLQAKRRVTFK